MLDKKSIGRSLLGQWVLSQNEYVEGALDEASTHVPRGFSRFTLPSTSNMGLGVPGFDHSPLPWSIASRIAHQPNMSRSLMQTHVDMFSFYYERI